MKNKLIIIIIAILTCFVLFIMYCRFIGTKGIKLEEKLVKDKVLPTSFYGTKVIHISDIHYKKTIFKKELNKIVKRVEKIKPDIIVFTGDLLDKNIKYNNKDIEELTNFLNNLNAKYGKFIITGDNDFEKLEEFHQIVDNTDVINLDDDYKILYNGDNNSIIISGISTIKNNKDINEKVLETKNKLLEENSEIKYSILLIHEPDIIDAFDYSKYNIIFAGHTLGGSIVLPFTGPLLLPQNGKKYSHGYYKLNNTKLFVSTGLGTEKYKLRFNNKPTINLYRLVNK